MKINSIIILSFLLFFSSYINAQMMDHRYVGVHYEYGATLNMRYGRINGYKGHFIFEAALPRLISSWAGWKVNENSKPVLQGRYLSLRGGRHFKTGKRSSLGFDIMWEFMGIAAPPDSGKTTTFTGYVCMPLAIGVAYTKSFDEKFSVLIIPSIGYALAKTRNNDGKHHARYAGDIYLQYNMSKYLTIYAGAGYGYYPKGLPMTWPKDKAFGGPLYSIGIALPTPGL